MLEMTLSQALTNAWRWRSRQPDMADHCFYVIYDGQAALYVGQSVLPLRRLQQHLGKQGAVRKSPLGWAITDALSVRAWAVKFFTLDDCAPLVVQHIPIARYQQLRDNPTMQPSLHLLTEQALIDEYHPRLNRNYVLTYDSAAASHERYRLRMPPSK